jgi:3'(2'), 5'-bisphosphate nucleotidase
MDAREALVKPLIDLCRQAGRVIREHYRASDADSFEDKSDQSPLTRADLASHRLIEAGLAGLEPVLPVLSEESSPGRLAGRRRWHRFWLVDPLDGTREFLARTGDFSINIALIEDHRPVLGVLYLPLTDEAWVGIPGRGAACHGPDGSVRALATRPLQPDRPLLVYASRYHHNGRLTTLVDWLEGQWGSVQRVRCGGALKFCRLAAGEGDLYPRFAPCSEWDTAAGQALLEAAGGALVDDRGRPLTYNRRDTLASPHFYAIADPAHPLWERLLTA